MLEKIGHSQQMSNFQPSEHSSNTPENKKDSLTSYNQAAEKPPEQGCISSFCTTVWSLISCIFLSMSKPATTPSVPVPDTKPNSPPPAEAEPETAIASAPTATESSPDEMIPFSSIVQREQEINESSKSKIPDLWLLLFPQLTAHWTYFQNLYYLLTSLDKAGQINYTKHKSKIDEYNLIADQLKIVIQLTNEIDLTPLEKFSIEGPKRLLSSFKVIAQTYGMQYPFEIQEQNIASFNQLTDNINELFSAFPIAYEELRQKLNSLITTRQEILDEKGRIQTACSQKKKAS